MVIDVNKLTRADAIPEQESLVHLRDSEIAAEGVDNQVVTGFGDGGLS